jgi:4-aminobutyrate aminotransferase
MEHFKVKPDIITIAKGMASGMPMGAIIASATVMSWKPGSHGNTFSGNPVCCAAGIATFDVIKNGAMKNAAAVGAYLMAEFKRMQKKYDIIGDVRGKGLMIGVEIVDSKKSRTKSHDKMEAIVHEAFKRGMLMLGCGTNTLRICPPLVITRDEARAGVEIIEQCIRSVMKTR